LYANLLLNGIQGIVTIPSTFSIGKKVGRRTLYLWSGLILCINYLNIDIDIYHA